MPLRVKAALRAAAASTSCCIPGDVTPSLNAAAVISSWRANRPRPCWQWSARASSSSARLSPPVPEQSSADGGQAQGMTTTRASRIHQHVNANARPRGSSASFPSVSPPRKSPSSDGQVASNAPAPKSLWMEVLDDLRYRDVPKHAASDEAPGPISTDEVIKMLDAELHGAGVDEVSLSSEQREEIERRVDVGSVAARTFPDLISPFDGKGHAISSEAYLEHQLALIAFERQARIEVQEEKRACEVPKLVEEGWALDSLEWYRVDDDAGHETRAQPSAREGLDDGKKVSKRKKKGASQSAGKDLPSLLVVFQRRGKQDLGWSRFRKGDMVELRPRARAFSGGKDVIDIDSPLIQGTLLSIGPTFLRIQIPFQPKPDVDGASGATDVVKGPTRNPALDILEAHPRWLVMQGSTDVLERRMEEAVRAVAKPSGDVKAKRKTKKKKATSESPDLKPQQGCGVADVILGGPAGTDHATTAVPLLQDVRISDWVKEARATDATSSPLPGLDGDLNASQVQAIATMLSERVSLIQGPPGTGKTRTLVAAVSLLKKHFKVPHPILLTSHTNVAVDNMALGCVQAGLKVVRAGPPERTREELTEVTLEERMKSHGLMPRLDEMRRQAIKLRSILESILRRNRSYAQRGISARGNGDDVTMMAAVANASAEEDERVQLRKRINRYVALSWYLRQLMAREILSTADVVVCTAVSTSSSALQFVELPIVLFDEGSMATEPMTLVPLTRGCKQLCLIGDQCQLPPVVASDEARRQGLGVSLFERLIARGDVATVMLDTQHRMHPSLSSWPNAAFYDGRLADQPNTKDIVPLASSFVAPSPRWAHPMEHNDDLADQQRRYLTFLHHEYPEERHDRSLQNDGEAREVCRVLLDLFIANPTLQAGDVGIVTPYLAQQLLLTRYLHAYDSPQRAWFDKQLEHALALRRRHIRDAELASARSRGETLDDAEVEQRISAAEKATLSSASDVRARTSPATLKQRLEVHTVDGFEGREKRAIVVSSVRSNAASHVGFVADARRLNVALTRAKSRLVVVGNHQTWSKATYGPGPNNGAAAAGPTSDLSIPADSSSAQTSETDPSKGTVADADAAHVRDFARYVRERGLLLDAHDISPSAGARAR